MRMRIFAHLRNAVLVALLPAIAASQVWGVSPSPQSQPAEALTRGLQQFSTLMRAGSFAEAETAAAKLTAEFPQSAEAQQAYASALENQGKLEAATAHLRTAVELAPNSPSAHLNLGSNYFRRGLTAKAREQFETAGRLKPDDANAFYNAGLADLKLDDFAAALGAFERAHKLSPSSVEISYYLAMSYVVGAKAADARSLMQSLPAQIQDRPEFQILAIAAESATGRSSEADAGLQRVMSAFTSPKAYATTAVLFLTAGDATLAARVMEAANTKFPGNPQIEYLLATSYSRAHQLQPALDAIKAALAQSDLPELHELYGKLLEEHGDSVNAAHELQRAAELDPSEANLNAWGVELLDHWTFDAAVEVFRSGLMKHPDSQTLRTGLAIAYFASGDYDSAIKTVLTSRTEQATDDLLAVAIASLPNSHVNGDEIRSFTKAYAREHPSSGWANYYAALAITDDPNHVASGAERQQAIQMLHRAASLEPKVAQFQYHLGVALSDDGKWPEALAAFRSAVTLDPELPQAWYRLALAAKRTGQIQESEEAMAKYTTASDRANSELQNRMAQTKKFVASLPK